MAKSKLPDFLLSFRVFFRPEAYNFCLIRFCILIPSYLVEQDSDAEGCKRVSNAKVHHASEVKIIHPLLFFRIHWSISYWRYATHYECQGVQADKENNEDGVKFLLCSELFAFFGQFCLLDNEKELEEIQKQDCYAYKQRISVHIHDPYVHIIGF